MCATATLLIPVVGRADAGTHARNEHANQTPGGDLSGKRIV